MAKEDKPHLEVLLTCPVCRDIFKEPRHLPCGHSICMECLEGMVDHSSEVPFRCPDCRADFGKVVGVQKTYALASIAEDYRENRKHRTESVYCDCCPERTTVAAKTCLKCEVSLCKKHLKDHQELPVFTGHPLVTPLSDLQKRKCPQHEDEVLRYYCSSSRRYICNICALESRQLNLATEASNILSRKMTDYMDQHFKYLEGKIEESKNTIRKLQDDIQRARHNVNLGDSSLNSVTVVLLCLWFIVLYYAYSYSVENQTLTEKLDKQQTEEHQICTTIARLLADHPLSNHRYEEAEDAGALTLDLDTASPFLTVSLDRRSVERARSKLDYPSHKSRFDEAPQVLSTACFTSGTHLWQVQAEGHWSIAVSYKSIQRTGKDSSTFGHNSRSWSLTHDDLGQLSALHNGNNKVLSAALKSNQIEVVVKIEKGSITFASVGPTSTEMLHEFQAELTERVCLGLGLYHADPPSKASVVKVH